MSSSSLLRIALVLSFIPWSIPLEVSAQAENQEVINRSGDPALRAFHWRSIGPVGQGGRVDDLAVDPSNPHRYFVGLRLLVYGGPSTTEQLLSRSSTLMQLIRSGR